MTGDLGLSPIKKEPKRVIYSHRSSHPEAVGSDCTVSQTLFLLDFIGSDRREIVREKTGWKQI